jgi:uncharacterized protein (TIGR00251 family)
MNCLQPCGENAVIIQLHVQPRAKKNGIAGLYGDALKLRLSTPPVDGKANKAVEAYLGKLFGVPKSAVQLHSGHQNRNKRVRIEGIDLRQAKEMLRTILQEESA